MAKKITIKKPKEVWTGFAILTAFLNVALLVVDLIKAASGDEAEAE